MSQKVGPPIDKLDPAWRQLKLWLSVRIRSCQRQLENPNPLIPEATHQALRGRIAAYRALIAEVEPEQKVPEESIEPLEYHGAGEDFNYDV